MKPETNKLLRKIIREEIHNVKLSEAPSRNIPAIEKLVAEINALIEKDHEHEGVIDKTNTWEEPYIYEPIIYKNGRLKIVSYSPYSSHKKDTDIINGSDMKLDGIPTLQNIRKMYKAMLKRNIKR